MTEDDVEETFRFSVTPGDVVVVTIRDDVSDSSIANMEPLMSQFAGDSGAMVLIFRARVLSDISRLSLDNLLDLQGRIETAITTISQRDAKGEA